jgi:hypothetical protein
VKLRLGMAEQRGLFDKRRRAVGVGAGDRLALAVERKRRV